MNHDPITWKIGAEPATLRGDEFWARYDHFNMPEKFEAIHGKLFWNDEQRLHVLAMLLEAVETIATTVKTILNGCQPGEVEEIAATHKKQELSEVCAA